MGSQHNWSVSLKMSAVFGTPSAQNIDVKRFGEVFCEQAYINGEFVSTGVTFPVEDPATDKAFANVTVVDRELTEKAIDHAAEAFKSWSKKTPKERGALVAKWGQLMLDHKNEIGAIITAENGKPLAEGIGETAYSASFCDWAAHECRRVHGDTMASPWADRRIVTIKQPIGVAGMIAPWNFPAAMIARKVAPAIAVGCTVVIKPPSLTPLSALALGKLAHKAGIPAGVVNIVPTNKANSSSVGAAICESEKVTALSFTGSTGVGKLLLKQCAGTVKKCSMELGGQAPFIVFPTADLDKAVQGLMASKFRNTGQTCVCANNIMVHEDVHDEFIAKLKTTVEKELHFGDVFNGATQGAMINEAGIRKVEEHIADALKKGAKVVTGGKRLSGFTRYIEPTILIDVPRDALAFRDETFGPLAAIGKFRDENDVLDFCNEARVGLAGYFFSRDAGQIWRVAEKMEVGMVGANTGMLSCCEGPFGGYKESGLGREGSLIGTEEYLETKYICMNDC